jgi:hypothetical protein
MPVASTAGPDARNRIRAPIVSGSPLSTSITETRNSDGTVPWITDSALHSIPGRTSESFMIGSAAPAAVGTTADASSATMVASRTLIAARLPEAAVEGRT